MRHTRSADAAYTRDTATTTPRFDPLKPEDRRQAGYWSWRAHSAIRSSSVNVRPDERIVASS